MACRRAAALHSAKKLRAAARLAIKGPPGIVDDSSMSTPRIIVTGGSGKAGYWIIKHFVEAGYDVISVDNRRPAIAQCRSIVADLTQLGQVVTAFSPHGTGNRRPYKSQGF
jgi:glutamate dehydrogenase/leucine dehydrogenase